MSSAFEAWQKDFESGPAAKTLFYMHLVGFPIVIVLGSGLNIVCIVVMLRQKVFPASASAFMLWITFNDALALPLKGTTHYLEEIADFNVAWWPYKKGALKHSSLLACQAYSAMTYYFLCGCPFYLAGLTLQRALVTLCPIRRPSLRASIATLAVLTCVALTFPIFRVFLVEYQPDSPTPCNMTSFQSPITRAFNIYQIVLSNLCVFAFLLFGTVCITGVMYCRRPTSRTRNTQRVSRTLLLMNVSFLLTYLPVGVFQLVIIAVGATVSDYRLAFSFLNSIMYLNFACNGLSYLVSQRFRAAARKCFSRPVGSIFNGACCNWRRRATEAIWRRRTCTVTPTTECSAKQTIPNSHSDDTT